MHNRWLLLGWRPVQQVWDYGTLGAEQPSQSTSGMSAFGTSGLAFTQLVLCQIQSAATVVIPDGALGFVHEIFYVKGSYCCRRFFPGLGTCPSGWAAHAAAAGRTLMPSYDNATVASAAPPLGSQEDRNHTHTLSTTVTPVGFIIIINA